MVSEPAVPDEKIVSQASRHILDMADASRQQVLSHANKELIILYYNVGKYLAEISDRYSRGQSYIDKIVEVIATESPVTKGFERRNLYRMRQFYLAYPDFEFVSTVLTQLSWSVNVLILSGSKTTEEREFYTDLAIRERYTVRELRRQMDSAYYERAMLSSKKLEPVPVPSKIKDAFMDAYVLDFLDVPNDYSEDDLQQAIVNNLRDFILEFGKDFTFVGQKYKLKVGSHDYFLDLLFFHRGLTCLVNIELKIGEFKPEYMGKMQLYLEALDRDVKKPYENPSVGIILCASKDDEVVEYAMSRTMSPTLVSQYQLTLPDKAVLEQKLREYVGLAEGRLLDADHATDASER